MFPSAAGAEPAGTPFRFSGDQPVEDLSLASAVDGQVLAAWSPSQAPSNSATTRLLSGSGTLDALRPLEQGSGDLAANPRLGEYLRTWEALSGVENYGTGLAAQTLAANGTARGLATTLAGSPWQGAFFDPQVTYSTRTRRYLVASNSGEEIGTYIGARLLDEQGNVIGGAGWGAQLPGAPDVAVRGGDGSYLVVYADVDESETQSSIRGQWIDSAGGLIGSSFLISAHRNLVGQVNNFAPRVAADPETGQMLVVWSDAFEVFARRIDAQGRPTGGDLWLSRMGPPSDPAWLTGSPDVAYNRQARQYLVVWRSGPGRDPYPIGEQVYGQHLDRSARQIGVNDFVISPADRSEDPRAVSVRGTNDWIVAWSDPYGVARRVAATTLGPPASLPENNPTPDAPPTTVPPVVAPRAPAPAQGTGSPPPATNPGPAGGVPASDDQRGRLTGRIVGRHPLRDLRGRGLLLRVDCAPGPCRIGATLAISRRTARRLGTGRKIARARARSAQAGAVALRMRPARSVIRRLSKVRRLKATLRLEATDAGGVVRRSTTQLQLRR